MSDTKTPYETKNNQGTAFLNERKTEDWHPKFQGKCKINEVMYFFSVNPKFTASGLEVMEFKLGKAVEAAPALTTPQPQTLDF